MKISFKRIRNYLALAFGIIVVFNSFTTFAAPQKKVLAADGIWLSAAQISYNNQTFSGPTTIEATGRIRYTSTGPAVSCNDPSPRSQTYGKIIKQWDYIEFDSNPSAAGTDASKGRYTDWIDVNAQNSGTGTDCQYSAKNVTLGNADRAKMTQAQGQCAGAQYNERQACIDKAAATICKNSGTEYDACVANQKAALPAGGLSPGSIAPPTDVLGGGSSGSGDNTQGDPDLNCGTEKSRMDWIICPVIKLVSSTVAGLDNLVTNLLEVDKKVVDETDANAGARYYKAWQSFRNLALGILVIAALIMLIGQALGFEVLDAYTLKKVMPRLVIAIIGIALSWQLMKWFVLFTNDLGFGIRRLIYAPFTDGMGDKVILQGGANAILWLLSFGAIAALKIGGLGFAVGSALLGLAVAIIVMLMRQIVVVLLLMLAPIAIACYVLPNTQGMWKLWHESFTKALLMFPIIMGFLAAGRVFAMVSSGPDSGVVGQLIAFFAYILPYFLIPVTFKFAGGAMRTVGGFANDRSRGMFDRMKKGRQAAVSKNLHDMKNFSYGNERTKFGRGVNNTLGAIANPTSMLRGRKGIQARRRSLHALQGQQTLKEDQIYQANQNDDTFLLAVANKELAQSKLQQDIAQRDSTLEIAREARAHGDIANAERFETMADKAQASVLARQNGLNTAAQMSMHTRNSRATQMAAFDALTKTGYQFSLGAEGYKELDDTIQKIVGNDQRSRAQMMDSAQYNIRASGQRFDLGGINHGAGFDGKTGTNKGSLYELANGKAESITQLVENLPANQISEAHAVAYQELKNMLPNAKGGNRDEIVKQMDRLDAQGIQEYMAGVVKEEDQLVQYNSALAAKDPTYAASWTPADAARGWKREDVIRTRGEIASRKARVYERPDPHRL